MRTFQAGHYVGAYLRHDGRTYLCHHRSTGLWRQTYLLARGTENMSEHKIEREAVLWAWSVLYGGPPEEYNVPNLIGQVLRGEDSMPAIRVAIAYIEAAKNHIDTVLELETNLARATEELESLRTVATWYRIADYNQRHFASTGTAESYRKAAEAMDKALGAGPGGT